MSFNCGIVGLPNVGKSTIFNAITSAGAESANYPFCTIEPNKGVVDIPDERLNKISEIVNPNKILPAFMEFVDIAGLVKGASKGEGLGNQFLSHIRETDAVAHVLRCFEDENIIHVANKVNPIEDMEIINLELIYADLDSCEKQLQRVERKVKNDKSVEHELKLLKRYLDLFNQGKMGYELTLTPEEKFLANQFHFITSKPTMIVCNVHENDIHKDNHFVIDVKNKVKELGIPVISICGTIEAELAEIKDKSEKKAFLEELGVLESGLDKMIKTGFSLLNLHSYFTAGVQEVRAWTIHKGDTAPIAAGVIHTDFEKGFIKAEVISYDDFIHYRGEHACKLNGKIRIEGKDYIVKDGDIMHFRFNV